MHLPHMCSTQLVTTAAGSAVATFADAAAAVTYLRHAGSTAVATNPPLLLQLLVGLPAAPDRQEVFHDGEGARPPVVLALVPVKQRYQAAVKPSHKALAVGSQGLHAVALIHTEGSTRLRALHGKIMQQWAHKYAVLQTAACMWRQT